MSILSVGVSEDQLPEFTDEVDNRTVVAGREAVLSCHVQHLGSYKVTTTNTHQDINIILLNNLDFDNTTISQKCCAALGSCTVALLLHSPALVEAAAAVSSLAMIHHVDTTSIVALPAECSHTPQVSIQYFPNAGKSKHNLAAGEYNKIFCIWTIQR